MPEQEGHISNLQNHIRPLCSPMLHDSWRGSEIQALLFFVTEIILSLSLSLSLSIGTRACSPSSVIIYIYGCSKSCQMHGKFRPYWLLPFNEPIAFVPHGDLEYSFNFFHVENNSTNVTILLEDHSRSFLATWTPKR